MSLPSRKQREIQQRHELILDIAKDLIASEGFANFRMDRIAEIAEYSKGTIYQHFQCKEEVLAHLCIRGIGIWKSFFERALKFEGLARERLLALHLGHDLYAKLYPIEYAGIYMVKSAGIREKISKETHAAIDLLISELMGLVVVVVDDGVKNHDVTLPKGFSPLDMVYGFWATHYGHLVFEHFNFAYGSMGVSDRIQILRGWLRLVLDGLPWRPLSTEHDYAAVAQNIYDQVYPEESKRLSRFAEEQK